jgi:hypothetical protein
VKRLETDRLVLVALVVVPVVTVSAARVDEPEDVALGNEIEVRKYGAVLKTAEPVPTSSVIDAARFADEPDTPTCFEALMVRNLLPDIPVRTRSVVVAVPFIVRPPAPVPSPIVEEARTEIPFVVVAGEMNVLPLVYDQSGVPTESEPSQSEEPPVIEVQKSVHAVPTTPPNEKLFDTRRVELVALVVVPVVTVSEAMVEDPDDVALGKEIEVRK